MEKPPHGGGAVNEVTVNATSVAHERTRASLLNSDSLSLFLFDSFDYA